MIKYRLHWGLHPNKDEKWAEEERARISEDEWYREHEINYALSVSGKVFSSFRADRHITTSPIKFNPKLPIHRVWDFGITNCVLYAQLDNHGRKRLIHERILTQSNIQEQARVAMQDSSTLFEDCEFYDICDPAGSWADERGSTPEVKYLEDRPYGLFMSYDRISILPTRERRDRAKKLIMRDLQETPNGEEALLIYCHPNNEDGCIVLKKAFQGGYCYKKDANGNTTERIKEPNHPYEDVMDCLMYLYIETDGLTGREGFDWDSGSVEPVMDNGYINPYIGY